MAEKKTHFGMAGHLAAMSEFLFRGWNAAVPFVDVGDDVLVVDDNDATILRIQVKTADGEEIRDANGALVEKVVRYNLSRAQLATPKEIELFFMFLVRWDRTWRFVLVRRDVLAKMRKQFVEVDRAGKRGRPPVDDDGAKSDGLGLDVTWKVDDAVGWRTSFATHLDQWPDEFPDLRPTVPKSPASAPSPAPETPPDQAPGADPPKVR